MVRNEDAVMTHAVLTSRLKQTGFEESADKALVVLNYFGYNSYIIDNVLPKDDRKLFYELSAAGILGTSQEETQLPDGRAWRIFYWNLRTDSSPQKPAEEPSLYEELPEDAWKRPLDAFPDEMNLAVTAMRRLKSPLKQEVAEFAMELLKTLRPSTVKTYTFDLCSALHDLGGVLEDKAVEKYLKSIKRGSHPTKKNADIYAKVLTRFRKWQEIE